MEFKETVTIRGPIRQVWAFLWDVELMVHCIPGCEGASVIEAQHRYQATIAQKVGPFQIRLPLDIEVRSQHPPHRMVVHAAGQDTKVGTRVSVDLKLVLSEHGADQTELAFAAEVIMLGKLATLGQPIIKRKAGQITGQFLENIKTQLEEGERVASV